jgi:gas vesicle protein
MNLTKAQTDFLNICWKMKVVNIIPQAAKLGIPEAEVRKYLTEKGLAIEQDGFVFQREAEGGEMRKVSDREFRRQVMEGYGKLQDAVRQASKSMLCWKDKHKQAIAWRLVDDVRGELLAALEQFSEPVEEAKEISPEEFMEAVREANRQYQAAVRKYTRIEKGWNAREGFDAQQAKLKETGKEVQYLHDQIVWLAGGLLAPASGNWGRLARTTMAAMLKPKRVT